MLERLATVTNDLKANPPRKFDVARTERVFNALFEFVEFELHNTFLDRKKVQIPAEFLGLARDEHTKRLLDDQVSGSLTLMTLAVGRAVVPSKNWILRSYLTNLPKLRQRGSSDCQQPHSSNVSKQFETLRGVLFWKNRRTSAPERDRPEP